MQQRSADFSRGRPVYRMSYRRTRNEIGRTRSRKRILERRRCRLLNGVQFHSSKSENRDDLLPLDVDRNFYERHGGNPLPWVTVLRHGPVRRKRLSTRWRRALTRDFHENKSFTLLGGIREAELHAAGTELLYLLSFYYSLQLSTSVFEVSSSSSFVLKK